MYCSSTCKAEHDKFIHHVECSRKPMPPVVVFCTKMLLYSIDIAGGFKSLINLVNDSFGHTVFDFDLSNTKDQSYKKNLLLVVHSMAMSEHSELVITENMKTTFNYPPFDSIWSTKDERELLIECFHKQLRVHNTNQLEMGEHMLEVEPEHTYWYAKRIGSGLCLFASLFNHSCDANVRRTCVDNKIAFVVGKPIAAGEQLFISYGYSSYRMPREERQDHLQRYSFTCDCVACIQDYPELQNLPTFDENFIEPNFDAVDVRTAVSQFKKNCDYIEDNFKHHPCYETTRLMTHNDHLLYQISRVTFD